jgi:hypothetical protein
MDIFYLFPNFFFQSVLNNFTSLCKPLRETAPIDQVPLFPTVPGFHYPWPVHWPHAKTRSPGRGERSRIAS